MKLKRRANQQCGLTAIDVLIVVVTLCLLAFFLFGSRRVSDRNPMAACQANLKQLTLAELIWVNDHDSVTFPAQSSTNAGGLSEFLRKVGCPTTSEDSLTS